MHMYGGAACGVERKQVGQEKGADAGVKFFSHRVESDNVTDVT